jgi:4'-phosphopantetheinyl transferase
MNIDTPSPSTGPIPENRVNVWWLDLATLSDGHWPTLEALLDTEERERAQRFHFLHDRHAYIAAHAVARALLTHWTGHEASSWRFIIGPYGKPEVVSPLDQPALRINLSHTRGLIGVALTPHHDIGVDVEWLERQCDIDGLAQQVFTPEERALLHNKPADQKQDIFLTLWTLKEAYIKAIGKGLSQPLDAFHFSLEPLAIQFKAALLDDVPNDPKTWGFHRANPTDTHRLALAIRHPDPSSLDVTIEAAPLDWIEGLTRAP